MSLSASAAHNMWTTRKYNKEKEEMVVHYVRTSANAPQFPESLSFGRAVTVPPTSATPSVHAV
jgi:hypothetical protein